MTQKKGSPDPTVAKHRDLRSAAILVAAEEIYAPLLSRAVESRPPNEDAIRAVEDARVPPNTCAPVVVA
jgi:uncharacterized protein YcgI (DUF1989 family)